MKMNFKKGFTLIELLVVVAIIGILASVVLASLNTARTKGSDAAIKADMSGVRASAEVAYDTNGQRYPLTLGTTTAGTDCGVTFTAGSMFDPASGGTVGASIDAALAHVKTQNGAVALFCNSGNTGYAIAATLKGGTFWCIDSTGAAKGTQGTGANAYTAQSGAATAALTDNADLTCN
ncbi:MAG TPA: type II secretion system protein [Candidatus Paceibacterota bacterium]|jgi:prepilin-type N-terminal cleavage/methylation domain-containing protein|nr:type II secretion system protein [Candidatus Paceibacterota bacterium]